MAGSLFRFTSQPLGYLLKEVFRDTLLKRTTWSLSVTSLCFSVIHGKDQDGTLLVMGYVASRQVPRKQGRCVICQHILRNQVSTSE